MRYGLQLLGPLPPVVEDGNQLRAFAFDSAGNDVRGIGHDPLARSEDAPWPPHVRLRGEQVDAFENPAGDPRRGGRKARR